VNQNLRALLFGTERGAVLAIVLALLAVGVGWALSLPVEPPLPSLSAGYWVVVLLYALPAILVGAYDGGLVWAWVAQTTPALVLWWPGLAAGRGFVALPAGLDPLVYVVLASVVAGTVGWVLGWLSGWVWETRPVTA
jgi:hypothetical protein